MKTKVRTPKFKSLNNLDPIIDFSQITKLKNLNIDKRMLESMPIGVSCLDEIFSHEGGLPCSTNIMAIGDPGIGKTTVMLDILASIQNKGRKCLFISGEMGRKQMFKYTERFSKFGIVDTLFTSDFIQFNTKDVLEQSLDLGYDCVLIDSIAEIIEGAREDNGWDRKTGEGWLVDVCFKQNKGENKLNKFTSFLLIQQVTKAGDFVGSNKLKHMVDGMVEMRRDLERDGGACTLAFTKNRNGEVNKKLGFELSNNNINYYEEILI